MSRFTLESKKKNLNGVYLGRQINFLKSSGHFDGRPLNSGYWKENLQLGLKMLAFQQRTGKGGGLRRTNISRKYPKSNWPECL